MPRRRRDLRREALRHEKRISRAWLRSVEDLKKRLSVEELAVAIAIGGLRNAEKLLPKKLILETLEPVVDAVIEAAAIGIELADREIEVLNRGSKR